MRKSSKIIGIVCAASFLCACSPQNEKGFASHPKAIQKALSACPEKQPGKKMTCGELEVVAARINQLAYKLQIDQQGFGKDILTLQETITEQRHHLDKNPSQSALRQDLKKNQQALQEHMAVVRWLEGPSR